MNLPRIAQFQVYNETLYALDTNGSLWKNSHPPTSDGWVPIPSPTFTQQKKEEKAIQIRYQIDKTPD